MTNELQFTVPGQPFGKESGRIKATDEQITIAYKEQQSCKKVAALFGICTQSVHNRLVKLGLNNPINIFSEKEKCILLKSYSSYADQGNIVELAKKLGRTKNFICRQARILGLTKRDRSKPYLAEVSRERAKKWHKSNPHPRGALGMKHSIESKKIMSEKSLRAWGLRTEKDRDAWSMRCSITGSKLNPINRDGASWKAGWRHIGDEKKYYRSRWEANYARYLQWLKNQKEIIDWQHEPETFWFDGIKRGCMSYLPDFKVTEKNESVVYHEVKGWMDDRSVTKIKRMAKYHPTIKLIVIDSKAYQSIAKTMKLVIKDWE
jgi:hypothetical protein